MKADLEATNHHQYSLSQATQDEIMLQIMIEFYNQASVIIEI
jgi:hypothetical protein